MAQFTLDAKTEVGKITLANFEEIKKDLTTALQEYKDFSVDEKNYAEAKTKRATLNKFDKSLNNARIDIKKQYLEPYTNFENQIKELTSLVAEVSTTIDNGIKAIDEREKNAKRLDIELFYKELNIPIKLDKVYKVEWENKSYKIDDIHDEILQLKAQVDKDLDYLDRFVANDDIMLKARIRATYLETLDLLGTIDKETTKLNEIKSLAVEEVMDDSLEIKDIQVMLTLNAKQWYQVVNFVKSIGGKITKIKGENQ